MSISGRQEKILEKELFLLILLHMPILTPVPAFAFSLFPFLHFFLVISNLYGSSCSLFFSREQDLQEKKQEKCGAEFI